MDAGSSTSASRIERRRVLFGESFGFANRSFLRSQR